MANERLRTPLTIEIVGDAVRSTDYINDADGRPIAKCYGVGTADALIAAVNQSAERIERLRQVLDQALSLAKNPYWMEKSDTREAIIKVISAALEDSHE